jgi:hypothetical protein
MGCIKSSTIELLEKSSYHYVYRMNRYGHFDKAVKMIEKKKKDD